jgi:hypothetical protein
MGVILADLWGVVLTVSVLQAEVRMARAQASSPPLESSIRQMRWGKGKDAGALAQKWLKEIATALRRHQSWKRMIFSAQLVCPSCRPRPPNNPTPANSPRKPNYCSVYCSWRRWQRDCSQQCSLAHKLRPPTAPGRDSVRNSERTNRISSTWHFAVANYRCFYTLRATRAVSSRTSGLDILRN